MPLLTWHMIVNTIHRPLVYLIGCIKLASSAMAHDWRTSSGNLYTFTMTCNLYCLHNSTVNLFESDPLYHAINILVVVMS